MEEWRNRGKLEIETLAVEVSGRIRRRFVRREGEGIEGKEVECLPTPWERSDLVRSECLPTPGRSRFVNNPGSIVLGEALFPPSGYDVSVEWKNSRTVPFETAEESFRKRAESPANDVPGKW